MSTKPKAFGQGEAQKVAHYISTHTDDLTVGDLTFISNLKCEVPTPETPIAIDDDRRTAPGGGYDNTCEAITKLLIAAIETRLYDENLRVLPSSRTPIFLKDLSAQEHDLQDAIKRFGQTIKDNSEWGEKIGQEAGRRIVGLANAAINYSLGIGRT